MKHRRELYLEGSIPPFYGELTYYQQEDTKKAAENFVHFLYSTYPFTRKALSQRVLKAIFCNQDTELLSAIQKELETLSSELVHILQKQSSENQEKLFEMVFGHMLSIYPFLEPHTKTLKIPQKLASGYELVEYQIERLELTPSWLGSPLCAFGLTSDKEKASPLLLFMGTPQPTASGYFLSIWADSAPGFTVGEIPFHLFIKDTIAAWLERTGSGVKVYGNSLGASLGILTACTFLDKIAECHAYSAPAPFKRVLHLYEQQKKEVGKTAQIRIYRQANDPIPLLGTGFHKDWQLFYIEEEKKQNPFLAHIRSVPAFDPLKVYTLDNAVDHDRALRKVFTFASYVVLVPAFALITLILGIKIITHFFTALFCSDNRQ